jgi:hypothetical protein
VTADLLVFGALVLVAVVGGVAIGILVIGPPLDRWAAKDDEEADDRRD